MPRGKIILCQVGNDNDLKYESMSLSQDMNLMLSEYHVKFFPFDSNSKDRKDLHIYLKTSNTYNRMKSCSDMTF